MGVDLTGKRGRDKQQQQQQDMLNSFEQMDDREVSKLAGCALLGITGHSRWEVEHASIDAVTCTGVMQVSCRNRRNIRQIMEQQ